MTPAQDPDLARQLGGEPSEVAELLDSQDVDVSGLALGELIKRGKRSVPALLDVLKNGNETTRAIAAEGLASIADPSTAGALTHALNDKNDMVRARAAQGLANMDDPHALDALLKTLDDAPDLLHAEYTLSAYNLANYGPRALPGVAPLLKSPDTMTRARAIFIVRRIVSGMNVQDSHLKQTLAGYDPYGDKADRDEAADDIIKWVEQDHPEKEPGPRKNDTEESRPQIDLGNF